MERYLGNDLIFKDQKVPTSLLLEAKHVLLYFSGVYSPPSQEFTPKLADFYTRCNEHQRILEIVFVSCDISHEDFRQYYSEMPWAAVPYEEKALRDILVRHYEVDGLPYLVLIDHKGSLLSNHCRSDLLTKSLEECLECWSEHKEFT